MFGSASKLPYLGSLGADLNSQGEIVYAIFMRNISHFRREEVL